MDSKESARMFLFESYITDSEVIEWAIQPVMEHQTQIEQEAHETLVKNYTGFRKGDAQYFHKLLYLWNKQDRKWFEQETLNRLLLIMRVRILKYWRQF